MSSATTPTTPSASHWPPTFNEIGRYIDPAGRRWFISARQASNTARTHDGQILVTFTCWRSSTPGKALDRTAAWGPDGWDISRWFPVSPRPVPEAILELVERKLKEMAPQAAPVQHQGVSHG